tara:strand:- start:71 stop:1018 length:948 start_codon:yes stop_codon:yes gene_type:complete
MRFDIKNDLRDANRSVRSKNPNRLITRQRKRLSSNSIKLVGAVKPIPYPQSVITNYTPNSTSQEDLNTFFITSISNGITYYYVQSTKPYGSEDYYNVVPSVSDNMLKFNGNITKDSSVLILNEYYTSNSSTNEQSTLIRCFEKVGDNMETTSSIDISANSAVTFLSDDGNRLGVCYKDNENRLSFRTYTFKLAGNFWDLVNDQFLFQAVNAELIDVKSDTQLSTITISYKQNNIGYTHIFSIDSIGNLTPRNNVIVNNDIFDYISSAPAVTDVEDFILISTITEKTTIYETSIVKYDYINNQYVQTDTIYQEVNK